MIPYDQGEHTLPGKDVMEDLNIKQLTLAVRTIAEEKNLPEETVLEIIEQAIAAAWRRDNGEREQEAMDALLALIADRFGEAE